MTDDLFKIKMNLDAARRSALVMFSILMIFAFLSSTSRAVNAEVLPKGISKLTVNGKYYFPYHKKYGENGNEEELAEDFNANLNSTVFPNLAHPPIYAGYQIGPIFVELVSSREGVNWTREEGNRPPILSLVAGQWDGGMIFTARSPLVEGNTVKLWYGGFKNVHDTPFNRQNGAIGLATLRKDGFASLGAGTTQGTILTKTFGNTGGPLLVDITPIPAAVRWKWRCWMRIPTCCPATARPIVSR